MANKSVMAYMRGKLYWAKIFGKPRPNYGGDAREWAFEFEPDENGVETLEEHDLSDRLKDKRKKKGYENREPFMNLRRKEFKFDGEPNDNIRVVDSDNQPWPGDKLLGNETVADVKVNIVDYGPGKKKGIYPVAIRIQEHVPYESNEFAGMDGGDAPAKKDTFAQDFGLDEDPPFDQSEEEAPKTKRRAKAPVEDLDDEIPM